MFIQHPCSQPNAIEDTIIENISVFNLTPNIIGTYLKKISSHNAANGKNNKNLHNP